MFDWSAGTYETTAEELEPVSERVIELAAPRPGDRVLDVACGTGNAAILAARRGAEVAGVDSAARLIDVARQRAQADGLAIDFRVADAQALPFADGSFDLVVSVFGLIFAPDPERAVADALRVLRQDGQALITVWIPKGPIDRILGITMRAVTAATGMSRDRFPWADERAVRDLAARQGAGASFEDAELEITADSPEDYLRRNENHPMQLVAAQVLRNAGTQDEVRERVLAALREDNEDSGGFRVHSPYRIITLRRDARTGGKRADA